MRLFHMTAWSGKARRATTGLLPSVLLLLMPCAAWAEELSDWRNIRVLKEGDSTGIAGCTFKGMAADDDMEDILKKASKIYGDTVVVKNTMRGKDFVVEVYRCQDKGGNR